VFAFVVAIAKRLYECALPTHLEPHAYIGINCCK